jgi:glutathione synthase
MPEDSTLALLWAAQDRGWDLFYMEQGDLFLRDGVARASVRHLEVQRDQARWFDARCATRARPRRARRDADAQGPTVRQRVPLLHAYPRGRRKRRLPGVNEPRALRDCNEKLFATRFPQCCPPLLVSRDPARLREFQREHGDVILKPLDAMGGAAVFRVRDGDPNFSVILETLTAHGSTTIMAQRYIPAIVDGDKRILMIDGEPVPYALARIPASRRNPRQSCRRRAGEARALSERDRWIASEVGPELRARGCCSSAWT